MGAEMCAPSNYEKGKNMKKIVMAVIICLAMVGMMGNALAQEKAPVAGMSIGVTANELVTVAKGWSAKNQIMAKDIYNDKNEKVGVVDDLIIAPDKAVSYVIIGTGGFLGMDKHDVAIRVNQINMVDGKIILPGPPRMRSRPCPLSSTLEVERPDCRGSDSITKWKDEKTALSLRCQKDYQPISVKDPQLYAGKGLLQ